jgi:hypothetical protein
MVCKVSKRARRETATYEGVFEERWTMDSLAEADLQASNGLGTTVSPGSRAGRWDGRFQNLFDRRNMVRAPIHAEKKITSA